MHFHSISLFTRSTVKLLYLLWYQTCHIHLSHQYDPLLHHVLLGVINDINTSKQNGWYSNWFYFQVWYHEVMKSFLVLKVIIWIYFGHYLVKVKPTNDITIYNIIRHSKNNMRTLGLDVHLNLRKRPNRGHDFSKNRDQIESTTSQNKRP